ncbi:nucleotidyltransferase domain-containing protein [Spirulina sp. CCNP1310]|uniref:nucleotidyltransferase domain-containing protein n=1 Tax=Spirulina sp. CCNP1310 TaxID=3110249 RepID=UPI002B2050D3|nr:nucleotidyltransferase domain-containing protein [Spirulina sp. CCNP1310]MEA5419319.1 nucleotidyltransferase domain-containing protein [Spirulina sp. CCNP1310]
MQHKNLSLVLEQVTGALVDHYQDRIESIILYGSQARGDAGDYSDIDLLIILKTLDHPYDEIDQTTDLMSQVCLDYDVVISWYFISLERFNAQDSPFMFNVKKEGIVYKPLTLLP